MKLYYDIAEALGIPNEFIGPLTIRGDCIWFTTKAGANYSARTVRNGTRLKKNSVRPA